MTEGWLLGPCTPISQVNRWQTHSPDR